MTLHKSLWFFLFFWSIYILTLMLVQFFPTKLLLLAWISDNVMKHCNHPTLPLYQVVQHSLHGLGNINCPVFCGQACGSWERPYELIGKDRGYRCRGVHLYVYVSAHWGSSSEMHCKDRKCSCMAFLPCAGLCALSRALCVLCHKSSMDMKKASRQCVWVCVAWA